MKKNLSISLFAIVISLSVSAQGIEFNHGTWNEIKETAKKEKKMIFVDFYTVWCAPCKFMAKEVFPDPQVG